MSKLLVVGEVWGFLRHKKKWWLSPIITILLLMAVLLVFVGSSALAPFIYSIF